MGEHSPLCSNESEWLKMGDCVAEVFLDLMYGHCMLQSPYKPHVLLGASLIRQYPPSSQHNLRSVGIALHRFVFERFLFEHLRAPPHEVLEHMHTHIQDLIQMDQKSLFPKLDPRLVVYLEGFCLPTLFEHNLRCVLMESDRLLCFLRVKWRKLKARAEKECEALMQDRCASTLRQCSMDEVLMMWSELVHPQSCELRSATLEQLATEAKDQDALLGMVQEEYRLRLRTAHALQAIQQAMPLPPSVLRWSL